MITKIEVGLRWGHLRIIDSEQEFRTDDISPGIREEVRRLRFKAACDCGKEFWIWKDHWKGNGA